VRKKGQEQVKNVKMKDCVRLSTVDNFQGEEADIVIISTVRNNSQGKVGFLQIPNRVNVMMSRAKVRGGRRGGDRETFVNSNSMACTYLEAQQP
jgi:superfamily I DNA and/or RNA helicase